MPRVEGVLRSGRLLATKLHVPWPLTGLVPRPRLTERLDDGLGRSLVLVCAPAGYGKTVLLADWARRVRPSVAWLSLDVGVNDPARFWRHGLAALDQVRPGLAERVEPLGTFHGSQAILSARVSQRQITDLGAALRRGLAE